MVDQVLFRERVVVVFHQMTYKASWVRGFLRLEASCRLCVRLFPQEGSVSPLISVFDSATLSLGSRKIGSIS